MDAEYNVIFLGFFLFFKFLRCGVGVGENGQGWL